MKNIRFYAILLLNFGFSGMCFSQTPDLNHLRTLNPEELRAFLEQYRPQEKKTSTSPDIVEHQWNFIFGKLFPDKRIYFGVDESGKPRYQRIREHAANNPDFEKVEAIVYHEAGTFSAETFENVGPVVRNGRFNRRLVNSIGAGWVSESKGGLWCPEQNVFIGGTRDKNMCDRFAEYMKQPVQPSKLSKIK